MKSFNTQSLKTPKTYQSGVTLLEVMITMLVLSIGLIGVASLQLHALQANQSSMQRSQAVNLTYDILDRLRANWDDATSTNNYLTNRVDARFANNFTVLGNCNPNFANNNLVNFATNDLNHWINSVRCTLPQAQARIMRDDNTNQFTIEIRWTSVNLEVSDDNFTESFTTVTRL